MPRRFATLIAAVTLTLIAFVPTSATASGSVENFGARLSSAHEVPVNDSLARGATVFKLSKDGSRLHYRLIVANIENVVMAHIHVGAPGVNGPIVAFLHPPQPPAEPIPGRTNGTLATGTVTAANLIGPLAGQSLDSLLDAIRAGNAYVNVHTVQLPAGEIRGQIASH